MACELSIWPELVRHGGALRQAGREATLLARGAPPCSPMLRPA
jgi:hypothetical protein